MILIIHRPQQRIAKETLDIYAPLANRLGIHWMQIELEELSIKYLDPIGYNTVKSKLTSVAKEKESYLGDIMGRVKAKIEEQGLKAEVNGRIKHLYSVYQKLKKQGIPFEGVYDILGIRIIVDTVAECYEVLGIIHSLWEAYTIKDKRFYRNCPRPTCTNLSIRQFSALSGKG